MPPREHKPSTPRAPASDVPRRPSPRGTPATPRQAQASPRPQNKPSNPFESRAASRPPAVKTPKRQSMAAAVARSIGGRLAVPSPKSPKRWKWVPRTSLRNSAREEAPAAAPSAELVSSIMASQMGSTIQAAAQAAADCALGMGTAEEQCAQIFDTACAAAVRSLEASGHELLGTGSTPPGLSRQHSHEISRIEATLARAIKKNAIRVVDLFQDWDQVWRAPAPCTKQVALPRRTGRFCALPPHAAACHRRHRASLPPHATAALLPHCCRRTDRA